MPEWPLENLTRERAWGYVHAAERGGYSHLGFLDHLDDKAQRELAGLSAFGESGDQPELLRLSVDPFVDGNRLPKFAPQHVRSALLRLGISEHDE